MLYNIIKHICPSQYALDNSVKVNAKYTFFLFWNNLIVSKICDKHVVFLNKEDIWSDEIFYLSFLKYPKVQMF